ncbi:MAG: hypothetical protein JNM93_04495 [Bacteriovoracaceae bacterium]|nr:hypothetical protein [Bacteriovoracaceae bacterium]
MFKCEIHKPLEIPELIINGKKTSPFDVNLSNPEAQVVFKKLAEVWSPLPHGLKNIKGQYQFPKEITFFGGSYNPWHLGHTSCVELFPKKDQLVIVPDYNPLKSEELDSLWENYLKILKLKQEHPKLQIYPGFWCNEKPNRTYPWVKQFKQDTPNTKINLLMGYDSFLGLPKWFEYQALLNLLNHLYVVAREDDKTLYEQSRLEYLTINPKLTITHLGHHDYESYKSQELRKLK